MFSLSFVSRNFLISLLISSVTCWLFRNVLFNLHVFVFFTVFSLVIDILSYTVVIREDAWYDFNFLKFTEVHSSALDIQLLITSRVFLISVIVLFVSVCLFFNSRSLLIDSYIFSILFSKFLIIFTIIFLNSFSGSLLISSSFILTSCVFSLFLHVCSISLPFHYFFFLTYCVWGLLFPVFKESWILSLKKLNSFLLLFSALLRLAQLFV